MIPRPRLRAAILTLAALAAGPLATARAEPLRVLVADGSRSLTIRSTGPLLLRERDRETILGQAGAGSSVTLVWDRKGVATPDGRLLSPAVSVRGQGAPLEVGGYTFRGTLDVRADGGTLQAINVLDVEEYLLGVIKAEMPADWPAEALKAQAIVARSFAVAQMRMNPDAPHHLRGTTASQLYRGLDGEDSRTATAVRQTRGLVLVQQGQVLPAFFHACSGGFTEDSDEVFGPLFPLIVGVPDDFGLACPHTVWQATLPRAEIARALRAGGERVGELLAIEPADYTATGRVRRLRIRHTRGELRLEARRFRELVGNDVIRSANFRVAPAGEVLLFGGRGWGHGVGLSQWGAKGMADLAYSFEQILRHYYPAAEIRPWY